MKCPTCSDVNLVMSDRQGIEIDYCPDCRGVWLDRGELDKVIERSIAPETQQKFKGEEREREKYPRDSKDSELQKRRKKKGLLGDLFDF